MSTILGNPVVLGGGGGGWVAQATAPTNTKLLWIDTANNNIVKYYNGVAWVAIGSAFG